MRHRRTYIRDIVLCDFCGSLIPVINLAEDSIPPYLCNRCEGFDSDDDIISCDLCEEIGRRSLNLCSNYENSESDEEVERILRDWEEFRSEDFYL